MPRAVALRLLGAVPVIVLVVFALFTLLQLAPGDAAQLLVPEDASPADVARLRAEWGLDQPVWRQFLDFLSHMLRLDFGQSFRYRAPVAGLIANTLPATLELASAALLMAVIIGLPLGIVGALRKGRLADGLASIVAIAGVSAPAFWIGILLVLLFSGRWNLLPSGDRLPYGVAIPPLTHFYTVDALLAGRFDLFVVALRHITLPAATLALGIMGIIARITRAALIDVGQEEFVTTAVAKGLTVAAIVRKHLLPNAAIPIATIIGLELGTLLSGSIVVEVVFSWPGIGTLLYQAVSVRDTPLTIGVVVVYTGIFIALNLLIDLAYLLIDPRLRLGRAG